MAEAHRFRSVRDFFKRFGFPAPVLQKLAGQFYRIPGNTIDTGNGGFIHLRQ